jgi:murein DD-endopeptidase MepM/ murein hydrolase activator NlpD
MLLSQDSGFRKFLPWLIAGSVLIALTRTSKALARAPGSSLVVQGRVSSPFGMRRLPTETVARQHWGIDVRAKEGSEVRIPMAGVVVDLSPDGRRSRYGNTALVEHKDGTVTLYAHLQGFGPGLRVGLPVKAGTVIGYVGKTHAPSTSVMAPHLHFEVLKSKIVSPAGVIVVNSSTPDRYEPQSWLASMGVPVATMA